MVALGSSKPVQSSPSLVMDDFNVLAGRPTASSVTLNVIPRSNVPWIVEWGQKPESLPYHSKKQETPSGQPVEMSIENLEPSTAYYYRIRNISENLHQKSPAFRGTFHTQRTNEESFVFTVTTDSHLVPHYPRSPVSPFAEVIARLNAEKTDFHITLGDEAMTHAVGIGMIAGNQPDADLCYENFRKHYETSAKKTPFFYCIGNHEGEGFIDEHFGHSYQLAKISQKARMKHIPNPLPGTYPEGGSQTSNYFAWTWGDALFIVIDPYTYSTTNPIKPEDWTLGQNQMKWLESVLMNSTKKWKILFQHQLVGGSVFPQNYGSYGQFRNYGRGGSAFARVGEQQKIHDLMIKYRGNIIFKGHDHVYADEEVDGIRYITCGRTLGKRNKKQQWVSLDDFSKLYPGGFDCTHGYTRVKVAPDGVTVTYIDLDGKVRGISSIKG